MELICRSKSNRPEKSEIICNTNMPLAKRAFLQRYFKPTNKIDNYKVNSFAF